MHLAKLVKFENEGPHRNASDLELGVFASLNLQAICGCGQCFNLFR